MTKRLLAGVAIAALTAGVANAEGHSAFTQGEGPFNWDSLAAFAESYDLSGQTVTIAGPWLSEEADNFNRMADFFEEATGATVTYTGSDSFEQQIVIDAEAGSAPNLAVFPQPGLAATLASRGQLAPLGGETGDWIRANFAAGQSWLDLGTYTDGSGNPDLFGFFFNVNVKSLVWYVPENFEDSGYEVPTTLEDLKALTEQIVADGGTPWCIGLGSGAATGWPATDWVEDMMLRTATPEQYDAWVINELSFNDPVVINAIEEFGYFARNDAFVAGGAGTVASTDFRDAPKGLFSSPPQCYMHKQASFIPAFFPEGTVIGQDADFFYFPAYAEGDLGTPVLGAGTLMAITDDSEATRAFIEYLKTPIAHELMMAQGGFLTPYSAVNSDAYASDTLRAQGDILLGASTFRFDGSDLMPGAIGAGSFWTGMVDYTGGKDAAAVAADIQASWDAIK